MTHNDVRETPKTSDKEYDAVAIQRQIREQISHDTTGMSFEELQHYLHGHITVLFTPSPVAAQCRSYVIPLPVSGDMGYRVISAVGNRLERRPTPYLGVAATWT